MVEAMLIDLRALLVEKEDCDAGTVAKVRELKKIGLLIWGNHAIRASVGAMRKTFAQIRKEGGIHGVESAIASVDDVFDLQGMRKVKDDEKRFLR